VTYYEARRTGAGQIAQGFENVHVEEIGISPAVPS
jgi:hypothetical protein